jgi:nucleoid-associated protein YgaU
MAGDVSRMADDMDAQRQEAQRDITGTKDRMKSEKKAAKQQAKAKHKQMKADAKAKMKAKKEAVRAKSKALKHAGEGTVHEADGIVQDVVKPAIN